MNVVFGTPVFKALSNEEVISWRQLLKTLRQRTIVVFHPENILPSDLLPRIDNDNVIQYLPLPKDHFKSIHSYNRLLLNPSFYEHFLGHQFLCIIQLDVFLLKDDFQKWEAMPYHYIGAPWFADWGKQESQQITGAGNGGFSMRHIESTIKLLRSKTRKYDLATSLRAILDHPFSLSIWKKYTFHNSTHYRRIHKINEDIWLARDAPKHLDWYKVAPPEVAIKFSFDAQPRYLYELNNKQLPTGIHAWWKYNPEFMVPIVQSCGHEWETQSTS